MKYFYVVFPILGLLARDGNPFSIKGKIVNILDFVAQMVIQLHFCSTKTETIYKQMGLVVFQYNFTCEH